MIDLSLKLKDLIYRAAGTGQDKHNSFKNPIFILLSIATAALIFFAYANHFSNSFHFDDGSAIVNNNAIKQVDIKEFFTDAATFTSLPTNQTYRPYTTLENAIDYKLAGGLEPKVFHAHIFISFLLVCLLLCVFVKKLLDSLEFSSHNQFWGLLVAAIFGLLCANAETVNYIIQRAEIVAGLYILLGFVALQKGGVWRTWYLYILFPFIGFFAKEMALVFAPLLFLYFLIFEENVDLLKFYKLVEFKKCLRSFQKALPAFIITISFYVFYSRMISSTFSPEGYSQYNYLITQPFVICHYILTYFIPYNLSADTDWKVFESIFDYRAIIGIVVVVSLLFIALKLAKNKETKLFSFGILWFFIALLPTSSFIPLAEVLNDHRSFIPYIGLTIAFVFGSKYVIEKYFTNAIKQKSIQGFLIVFLTVFFGANVYGIRERNKVWKDELSLWKDVSIKSPNNGRGLMNYGLALMGKGEYVEAEKYFNKALLLTPRYFYLYVNLGVLKNATGDKVAAENNFKKAISFSNANHKAWYFYGRFLLKEERYEDAKKFFIDAINESPTYSNTKTLLMKVYHHTSDWNALKQLANDMLKDNPNNTDALNYLDIAINKKSVLVSMENDVANTPTPEKYLNLSLKYFKLGQYDNCLVAAEKALELKSDYPAAYNNIGIANFHLKRYDRAIEAYEKALAINPDYQLAKNNLTNAMDERTKGNTVSLDSADPSLTAADYINLSLRYYNNKEFLKCIEASKKAIAIAPSANAYNNICAAYNQLKEYEKAIDACEEAIKLDSSHKLAKGNLTYAKSQTK